ncbi:HNH endonuclease signature motif containing protein, partial [Pseudomonas sp. CCC4.4]|uniref:HNH endonuclease n=1 Tax=Pseudomonas sp. CCC4.4 TaxID=3048612 RepID=UPI002B23C8EC
MPEIRIGTFQRKIFESDKKDFHLWKFRCSGGELITVALKGDAQKMPKTVEFTVFGEWESGKAGYPDRIKLSQIKRFEGESQVDSSQRKIDSEISSTLEEIPSPEKCSSIPSRLQSVCRPLSAPVKPGSCCGNCGLTTGLEIRHVVPLSVGGTNSLGNLVTLCFDCHEKSYRKSQPYNFKSAQAEGIAKAKERGAYKGRSVDKDLHRRVRELLGSSLGIRATARHAKCSTTT